MTEERLKQYRSKTEEIIELKNSCICVDTVNDYTSGYPIPISIRGLDVGAERETGRNIRELEQECRRIEKFIDSIPESLTRRMFRLHYIEGKKKTFQQTADQMHMDRSTVSKKIKNYLKVSHKSQKSRL